MTREPIQRNSAHNSSYVKLATSLVPPAISEHTTPVTHQAMLDPNCWCMGCRQHRPCVVKPLGHPATVYRVYGETGALIYVGCSRYAHERAALQARVQPYWADERAARVTMEHYRTHHEALTAEARAIATEDPLTNVKDERPPLHDGWVVVPLGIEVFYFGRPIPGLMGEPSIAVGWSWDAIWRSYAYELTLEEAAAELKEAS